jgi:hypothetical protein
MIKLEKLKDEYYKNVTDGDSEINFGTLALAKEWTFNFSLSSSLSGTDQECTFDRIGPTSPLSAYYYSFLMKSFHCDAINRWNGTHVFEWSVTSGKTYPNPVLQRNVIQAASLCSMTANLDSISLFATRMKYTGDMIDPATFSVYDVNGSRMFYSQKDSSSDSYCNLVPDSAYYGSLTTSLTAGHYLAWGIQDYGLFAIWSDIHALSSSLSSVDSVQFSGNLYFHNITTNIVIEPEEFTTTTNPSFADANTKSEVPKVNTTYITSVGFYNRWGELLLVAKPSHPIRRFLNVPITIKLSFDL